MTAGYSHPPPPSAGYYDHYHSHQTLAAQGQPAYGSQPYLPQSYAAATAPHSQAAQEGSGQAYPGIASAGYGSAPSRLPLNTSSQYSRGNGYGYDRPQKRGRDHGEYARKRSSGYQSRQSYPSGPPQDMRLPQNYAHGYPPPNSSSPPYQTSSPSQSYVPVSQYPQSPYPQHPPPACYPPPPSHGYQPTTSGPPPPNPPTVNGYSQGYPQATSNFEPYSAPPPPAAYTEPIKNPYPNQHAYPSAQSQLSYSNQASYQGQPPYSYAASASIPPPDDSTSMAHPQPPLPEFASYSQCNPYGPSQWEMPPSASETPSGGQGTGYDYTVPSERADEDEFEFPLGPEGSTLGKSDEYFAAMKELDEERFSWDGALHPLPNEPIDPNFSIGKAGIITMHFAEASRYPLAPSIEADNDARNNRPLLTTPITNVISRYFDEEGRLMLDCPHSDDPVFSVPNHRLDELVSVQNARLSLDAKDDEVDDVMTSLDNALNGDGTNATAAGPDTISIEEPKPALDPETERMLADLGVSGPGFGEASHPPGPARSVSPTQACPPPPPMHHEYHEPPQEYREPHQEYREPPREYREPYREYLDWQQDYPPQPQQDYPPQPQQDYPPQPQQDYPPQPQQDYPPQSPAPRITPPRSSPYPNGRRDSSGTAAGSDFGPPRSQSPPKSAPPPPPPPPQKVDDKENPLKRKQGDDFEPPVGTSRRRKSKVKGADTGSIYGRRD